MPTRTDVTSVLHEQNSPALASENRSGLPESRSVEPNTGFLAFRRTRFLDSVTWSQVVKSTGNSSTDAGDHHANGLRSQYA